MRSFRFSVATGFAVAMLSFISVSSAQAPQSLGTARVTRAVVANGQPLAAGTYSLRVTNERPTAGVGQNPEESRWIEFVQNGQVKGREMATVLTGEAAKTVLKGQRPANGTSKTETLKGDDYIRIWVNRGQVQYLIHLAVK